MTYDFSILESSLEMKKLLLDFCELEKDYEQNRLVGHMMNLLKVMVINNDRKTCMEMLDKLKKLSETVKDNEQYLIDEAELMKKFLNLDYHEEAKCIKDIDKKHAALKIMNQFDEKRTKARAHYAKVIQFTLVK